MHYLPDMIITGIGDEAANTIDGQIQAQQALGWKWIEMRGVEVPGFPKANFHEIPDAAFDIAAGKLKDAGIGVYCFGSTIMNWQKTVATPFDVTLGEVKRCIPRMQKLGSKFVRIMSFKPGDEEETTPAEVFTRVREVTKMFLDAGLQPVHENCMNYGGMSWKHALELLDQAPGLKWVFDTANPVFNADRSKVRPWKKQETWEFYTHLKPHTVHVHIKDARWNPAKNDADYTMPGEGDGDVRAVIKDLLASGYDGAFSIEPHVAVVFHDASVQASAEQQFNSYVQYGRSLENLIGQVQAELRTRQAA
jgi:sugar phosphate isomerase/epimerase